MEGASSELELLSHFDRPAERRQPRPVRVRGIGWVLQWAAALAVFIVAASTLARFGYCVAAELALHRAACAGVLEATLPRATRQSVTDSIERRLASYSLPPQYLRFSLLQNGAPIGRVFRPGDGDRLSVLLTVPATAVLPGWLQKLSFWHTDVQLIAHVERRMPGRTLPPPTP